MTSHEAGIRATDIAIVGLSGRFPGASDTAQLWRNLVAGTESLRHFTADELRAEGADPRLLDQPDFVPCGGTLADVEQFDAAFFGFTPREAEILDPQHRLFLECAWEALEGAGHPPARFAGAIGVYAGAGASTHLHRLLGSPELVRSLSTLQITIGNEKDHLSTRTAYKLGLRGPAVTVQTTCSSSLVAVTLACSALLAGQCDLALAGGASVVLPQRIGYRYRVGGILSPDGHCRAFDAQAAGTVGGNGVAVVALRRLRDAVADGDDVHAVVRGFAINNDGSVKVGYTAPSVDGQAAVIRRALQEAGVTPAEIGYVEAHGTGTSLGDPIEVAALTDAFGGPATGAPKTCRIGSLKTNIGHLDAAAGAAGLIKTVLALRNEMIPPSLNYTAPNPQLRLADTPFEVVVEPTPWPAGPAARLAGVSSFGIGGTNAHVVVGEAPPRAPRPDVEHPLLLVSARSADAADRACALLADHLQEHPEITLADAAFTLQSGRQFFRHRRAVVGADRAAVIATLRGARPGLIGGVAEDEAPVSFLLPGQGSQYPGMAAALYHAAPAFRAEVDACCEILAPLLGRDLRALLLERGSDDAVRELTRTELAQPALFVTELAMAAQLRTLGVGPDAMLGHSLGELTAACVAGVFDRADALRLVVERGRLMGAAPRGAMLAVLLDADELAGLLIPGVEIAARNAPSVSTVSGPTEAIADFAALLAATGVGAQPLPVSHAFHSASMQDAADRFATAVAAVDRRAPRVRYLSNITGDWTDTARAVDPAAWGAHIRRRVRFAEGASALLGTGAVAVEVGPGGALSGLVRRCAATGGGQAATPAPIRTMPGTGDPTGDVAARQLFAEAVGRLWVAGVELDWAAYNGDRPPRRVPLPTYPFERARFWIDTPAPSARGPAPAVRDGHGARRPVEEWLSVPAWHRAAPLLATVPSRTATVLGRSPLASAIRAQLAARGWSVPDGFARVRDADVVADLRSLDGGDARPLFDAAVELVRLLGRGAGTASTGARRQLVLVTDRAHEVVGGEEVRPEQTALHGLAKVISQEHPALAARTVDVVAPAADAEQLAVEIAAGTDPSVALRGTYRWLPGFAVVHGEAGPSRIRSGGAYLVTGGLGRVGLAFAAYLARSTAGTRLALLSRTPLPPRRSWAAVAESGGPATAVLRRLYALEQAGVEVLPLAADVGDSAALHGALATVRERFGRLDGVLHAAGAVGPDAFAPIAELTPAQVGRQFAAKVIGTQLLDGALGDLLRTDTSAWAMFTSSLSAELGGLGFGAYAAANAYLDGFAARTRRWTSVAWEGWRFAGPAAGTPLTGPAALALTPEEGTAMFARIAALPPAPRLVVSTGDLDYRARSWLTAAGPPSGTTTAAEPAVAPPAAGHARPQLGTAYAAPADDLERSIAAIWQDLLGVADIGRNDDFFALGGHSLLAIQLISRLRDRFAVEVSLHAVFDAPTVAELTALVRTVRTGAAAAEEQRLRELLDLVEGMSEDEVEALLAADGNDG